MMARTRSASSEHNLEQEVAGEARGGGKQHEAPALDDRLRGLLATLAFVAPLPEGGERTSSTGRLFSPSTPGLHEEEALQLTT